VGAISAPSCEAYVSNDIDVENPRSRRSSCDCGHDGRDVTEEVTEGEPVERQEIADELSTTGAQELLASPSAAHLAYLGRDGTPRVIPVGFFWTGDRVVISSATTSPKVAALSARPDVALTIDAGDTPDRARALSIRGRANVEIVDGVVEEYLAAARKRWMPKRRPSSSRTSAGCTSRWRGGKQLHRPGTGQPAPKPQPHPPPGRPVTDAGIATPALEGQST
jgi:nitroimidazol reductase NimA-like FMN-containing flavoprotein (pyridoxamine 5'-phosphate oxidase superfamily)